MFIRNRKSGWTTSLTKKSSNYLSQIKTPNCSSMKEKSKEVPYTDEWLKCETKGDCKLRKNDHASDSD